MSDITPDRMTTSPSQTRHAGESTSLDRISSSPGAGQHRLTSRDLGLCAAFVVFFCLPWVSQVLHESARAAGILTASMGATGLAVIILPTGVVAYFVVRSRLSWGWKLAAWCAALVAWTLICKLLLVGQVGLAADFSPRRLMVAVPAGLVALASLRWGRDRHLPYVACAVGALSLIIVLRQLLFGLFVGDVYIFQQGLWTTLHGAGLFHVSDEGGSHFGTHWSPALLALLPVYALWPSAIPLLVLQSAALAAAAFPVHALARRHFDEGEALALTAGFMLLPSVLGPTLASFHEATFGLSAFVAALAYFERRRPLGFALFSALALLIKETMAAPVALFAVYAVVQRREWRWIVLPALGACLYGAVAFGVIMPRFHTAESDRPFTYLYGYLGKAPGPAARYLATHPRRAVRLLTRGRNREYLDRIAAPFGYVLPLGSAPVIFGVPDVAAVLLARPSPWPVRHPASHYSMLVVSALFVGFLYTVAYLARRLRVSRTPVILAIVLFFMAAATGGVGEILRYRSVLPPDVVAARRELAAMVPPRASVVSTWATTPLLANRREIYEEREGTLSRVHTQYYLTFLHVATPQEKAGLRANGWALVSEKSGFSLWRRVGPGQQPASP